MTPKRQFKRTDDEVTQDIMNQITAALVIIFLIVAFVKACGVGR